MLSNSTGHKSCPTNDIHFHADVFHIHEFQGILHFLYYCSHVLPINLLILNFIFKNVHWYVSLQLNIHRFKVVARFGLMHVVATNLCVWIRTLVLESLKEISAYQNRHITETVPVTDEDSAAGKCVHNFILFLKNM